jgi:dTDP-4-amino-4,6-dideoxygalactose transaminase
LKIPFLKPQPAKVSDHLSSFEAIEASGIYSNFGPQNTRFEARMIEHIFGGKGMCMTVCNATIGLMLAVREVVDTAANPRAKYALVPSFTFAATPHAAIWCGLKPILYDIDPKTWLPSMSEEDRLLDIYGDEVGVIIPYATFGNSLDLNRYEKIAVERKVPIVVDAAASLGSLDNFGHGFGTNSNLTIVFSMHVTKTFSTSEGGLIYSSDKTRMQRLRIMSNYGFSEPRSAGMAGLNAKLSEVASVIAQGKLESFDDVIGRRQNIYKSYQLALPNFEFQEHCGKRVASQFVPVLMPKGLQLDRSDVMNCAEKLGVSVGSYFSPHVAEQPYFRERCMIEPLPVTDIVSSRILSLPIYDTMTDREVEYVANTLNAAITSSKAGIQ